MQTVAKDYRVTVKVRNNRILKAIENEGGVPGQKWCDENGINYTTLNDLINMKKSPVTKDGRLSVPAQKLCDILGVLPDDLWSIAQLQPIEKNYSEIEMDELQVAAIMQDGAATYLMSIDDYQKEKAVANAVSGLTAREQKVIRLRFFDDATLADVSEIIGVSPPRVRQIEMKALRKLRKPDRLASLADVMYEDDEYKNKAMERILD